MGGKINLEEKPLLSAHGWGGGAAGMNYDNSEKINGKPLCIYLGFIIWEFSEQILFSALGKKKYGKPPFQNLFLNNEIFGGGVSMGYFHRRWASIMKNERFIQFAGLDFWKSNSIIQLWLFTEISLHWRLHTYVWSVLYSHVLYCTVWPQAIKNYKKINKIFIFFLFLFIFWIWSLGSVFIILFLSFYHEPVRQSLKLLKEKMPKVLCQFWIFL